MQPCIIDSCSLLHAFHVQVGVASLSDLVAKHFDVVLPRTILQEMQTVLGRAHRHWKERGLVVEEFSEIRRIHAAWTAPKCFDGDLELEMRSVGGVDLEHLGAGEVACIALARGISDREVSYVVFVTDDYDAGECAKTIFDKYQCGMVIRSADLITFFGIRFKLAKAEVHQSLRTLISFYTGVYESLLQEAKSLLPGSEASYIYPFIQAGDLDRAKQAIVRLPLNAATRTRLTTLVEDVSALTGDKSILSHSFSRLRELERLQL